jgi:hypothetical protein
MNTGARDNGSNNNFSKGSQKSFQNQNPENYPKSQSNFHQQVIENMYDSSKFFGGSNYCQNKQENINMAPFNQQIYNVHFQ